MPSVLPQMRWTPAEVRENQTGSEQIGSSGLVGVSTKVLFGDPTKAGFYTIVLFVPAPYDDRRACAPRRSDGGCRLRHVAVRVWRPIR